MMSGRKGLLITVEGGEKSGKTTQAGELARWLRQLGKTVVLTREPGGTQVGESIRDVLLRPSGPSLRPVTEALLFAASRSQLVEDVIRPAISAGAIVVADRFVDSSLAYQSFGLGLPLDPLISVNEWATGGLWPDLTFILDCNPGVLESRPRAGTADRIESRDEGFHRRVTEGYRQLAERFPERCVLIDASGPVEDVASAIRCVVVTRFKGREVPGQ